MLLSIVVGHIGSLHNGSVQGLLAADSAIKDIFGRFVRAVNEAYADIELGGSTEDKSPGIGNCDKL